MAISKSDERLDPRVVRTKAVVLDAARELLAESGFGGFTVEEIVARTGVAKTTIYRHWPTKAELLLETIERFTESPWAPDTGALRTDLVELMTRLARVLANDPWVKSLPSLIDAAQRDPELAAVHTRVVRAKSAGMRAVLDRAAERGELKPDVDLELVWHMLVGPLFFRQIIARRSTSPAEVVQLIDAALGGLGASASRRARRRR